MESFSVSTCPACVNWCIQYDHTTSKTDLEWFMTEHIYECFGISEILADMPWSA